VDMAVRENLEIGEKKACVGYYAGLRRKV
jgi:hypothetical protein